jgi:predicted nucleic acid-binding protein
MAFVLDNSVAAVWVLPDEGNPVASRALELLEDQGAVTPSLWRFEARNMLVMNERRGRIDASQTAGALRLFASLPIATDDRCEESELLRLARQHRLTVYDAAYLELALRLRAPLATLDANLIAAAKAEGVVLVQG